MKDYDLVWVMIAGLSRLHNSGDTKGYVCFCKTREGTDASYVRFMTTEKNKTCRKGCSSTNQTCREIRQATSKGSREDWNKAGQADNQSPKVWGSVPEKKKYSWHPKPSEQSVQTRLNTTAGQTTMISTCGYKTNGHCRKTSFSDIQWTTLMLVQSYMHLIIL